MLEDTPDSHIPKTDSLPHEVNGVVSSPQSIATPVAPPSPAPSASVWWEVAAVLAVGVVPHLISAVQILCAPGDLRPRLYWLDSFALSAICGCTIFVTLYLIGRSGEPWAKFGIVRPNCWDVAIGLLLFLLADIVWRLASRLPDFGTQATYSFPTPRTPTDYALMTLKFSFGAFAEELVTRAYLITRLTKLLRSRWEAVVCAAILFASYHVYQGPMGAIYALALGLVYGIAFLVNNRVWPLVLGHTLYNIYLEVFLR